MMKGLPCSGQNRFDVEGRKYYIQFDVGRDTQATLTLASTPVPLGTLPRTEVVSSPFPSVITTLPFLDETQVRREIVKEQAALAGASLPQPDIPLKVKIDIKVRGWLC